MTGHADEWNPGWNDSLNSPIYKTSLNTTTGYRAFEVFCWIDGLLRLGYILNDPALLDKANKRIEEYLQLSDADGRPFWLKTGGGGITDNEFWYTFYFVAKPLLQRYEATGDPRMIRSLERIFLDDKIFGDVASWNITPHWGYKDTAPLIIETMLDTYTYGGDKRILDKALAICRHQESAKVVDQFAKGDFSQVARTHGVWFAEQMKIPAVAYPWVQDKRFLQASVRAADFVLHAHTLPYGVPAGDESLAGTAPVATETCYVPDFLWSWIRILQATGNGTYADRIERAFLNAGPGTMDMDCGRHVYSQLINRVTGKEKDCNGNSPECLYQRFFMPQCCTANVNRILPLYVSHMWMETADRGLAFSLYGPCQVNALVGDGIATKIICKTVFPFEESMELTLSPQHATAFPLYLRLPDWCDKPAIAINGTPIAIVAGNHKDGYVRLEKTWSPDDKVLLQLPMRVRLDKIEKSLVLQPFASISHGPLLYALALPEVDANHPHSDARWRYALGLDAQTIGQRGRVTRHPMPPKWHWSPPAAPVRLGVPAMTLTQPQWPDQQKFAPALPPVLTEAREDLELVPYGCTTFRIAMFPLLAPPAAHEPSEPK